jgi:hypothetical protein
MKVDGSARMRKCASMSAEQTSGTDAFRIASILTLVHGAPLFALGVLNFFVVPTFMDMYADFPLSVLPAPT